MMLKRIFSAITAAAICLTISSCGGNENEQVTETTAEGKKTIKMTVMGKSIDTDFQLRIAEFNRTSKGYEIEVTDRGTDLSNAVDKLNLEIISGTTPDIVDGFFLPVESYAEKGLLADYYDFIDNDPEMCREDFLENIFKACEINGGLYENITSFSIHTLIDRKSIADEMQGRTSDDFIDLAERHPDKMLFNIQMYSHGLFDGFMRNGWQSFVDRESGKCDFNSERFIRILEFCSTFPDTFNYTMSDPNNEQSEQVLFNTDHNQIHNFYSLRKLERIFGEPPAVVGFPDAEGNGAVIRANGSYIVFENSPVKEGVWEFLRTDYLDEQQNRIVTGDEYHTAGGSFPVRRSVLEFAIEEAKREVHQDYPGEYPDDFGTNTDEDNQKILDIINGAACRFQITENFVYDTIITEEAGTYFSGQKSAKETAEIIQNRVQNYLDENR